MRSESIAQSQSERRQWQLAVRVVLPLCLLLIEASLQPLAAIEDEVEPSRVLLIASHDQFLPGNLEGIESFRASIDSSQHPIELYYEYLDLVRFDSEEHAQLLVEYLQRKYRERPIDIVMTVGVEALVFARRNWSPDWSQLSLTFMAVQEGALAVNPDIEGLGDATGVLIPSPTVPTVELGLELRPQTRHLLVVNGEESRTVHAELMRNDLARYEGRLEVDYLTGVPIEELLARAESLPDDWLILVRTYLRDVEGRSYYTADVVKALSERASVPVLGTWSTLIGPGAIGGRVIDIRDQGRQSARLIERLLTAGPGVARQEPPLTSRLDTRLDDRQLRRWHIPRSRIPEDATIMFPVTTVFSRNRGLILALGVVLVAQTLMLLTLFNRGRRLRAASAEAQRLHRELAHVGRVGSMGVLAGSLSHELNQPLAAIMTNAQAARRFLESESPDFEELEQILDDIVDDDRRAGEVIRRLRAFLSRGEVETAQLRLNSVVKDVLVLIRSETDLRRAKLELSFGSGLPSVVGDRIQLQQVVINLLQNAIDAAISGNDRRISLTTRISPQNADRVELVVRDHGPGLPSGEEERIFEPFFSRREGGMGLGLAICRTIVEAQGGSLEARNAEGGGAVFVLSLSVTGTRKETSGALHLPG